jgi:hypothetical protein
MTNCASRRDGGAVSRSRGGSIEERFEACREIEAQAFRSYRRGALLSLAAAFFSFVALAGCGSSGAANTVTTTPTISLSITQAPPASLSVGGTATVSATVTNDVANAGVDWVAMCGSAPNCGSFSPPHTASGAASTFTAPLDVPSGNTVAITALSTTDHAKAFAASVTITSTVTGVTITQPPPATFPSGGSLSLTAIVAGDPSNAGIDWKATCGIIDCSSSFNGAHSAAGSPTTFIVPVQSVTFPTIVGSTVTVTAFATADHNFSASATFVVSGPVSINITQGPPSTLLTNATAVLIAVVTNDNTNSGVTWTVVSCDAAPCGSIAPIHTASGASTTYTAPPTPVNHVILQAAATASPTAAIATVEISITAPISVAITQGLRNNTIVKGASEPLVATVSDDNANAGVDWTVTCPSPTCGSFSPTHTASGSITTFTAPATVPTGNSVMITATSTTDPSKSATETATVTVGVPPNGLLFGQFVISMTAKNSADGPYAFGGVITGDGNGNITKGNVDLVDASGNASPASSVPIISPSTYSIGPDGRGQIQLTINTADLSGTFGVNGSGLVNLSVVFVTPEHALLSESDSFGGGTGTLDLQNAADLAAFQNKSTGPNGVYALSLAGIEFAAPNPKYFVAGALALHSSAGTYTETAYVADQSDKGVITSIPSHPVSHVFSNPVPDQNGELVLDAVNLGLPTKFNLDAWLIDAHHFVVTDWRDSFAGTPRVIVIGSLTIQFTAPFISGSYAFTESGATVAAVPQAAGGVFTCASTGTLDVTPLGGTLTTNQAITVACTPPTAGRGLVTISGAGSTGIKVFAAYQTVDRALQLIEVDGGGAGTSGPSGLGVAMQQTLAAPILPSAFKGDYASTFAANTALGLENFAGQVISDGVSTLSGVVDVNSFNGTSAPPAGIASPNAVLTGSFTAGTTGRFPLALAITPAVGQPTPEITIIHPACYLVDANTCLLLGLDAAAPGLGILQLQNTGL